MNPVLEEIYSTIIPSAPYLIVAYVFIWLVIFVWIFVQFRKSKELTKRVELLEEEIQKKTKL